MKKLLLILFLSLTVIANAQVAINTDGTLPDNSAMLDVKSSEKGMLFPRMTTSQRDAITSPAAGLLVFNATTNSFDYFTGTSWVKLGTALANGTTAGDMLVWNGTQWESASYRYYYADRDGDTYGDAFSLFYSSSQPFGFVTNDCDGDDNDAGSGGGNPSLRYPDTDGDGHGDPTKTPVSSCLAPPGYAYYYQDDCDDENALAFPGSPEYCDGFDNDCNGQIDEKYTLYADSDHDGFGDPNNLILSCFPFPAGYILNNTDCNDQNYYTNPGFIGEVCDGIDNNCNGQIDEGTVYVFQDSDNDGYGNNNAEALEWICGETPPQGYVANVTDCDDSNPDVHPGATEVCDGIDNNCNFMVDDNVISLTTFYADIDNDGYGDQNNTATAVGCMPPAGFVSNSQDCVDSNPNIHPGVLELCDGIDNNCNGQVDEGEVVNGTPYYFDNDLDGHGDVTYTIFLCYIQPGWSSIPDDCDDFSAAIFPGAPEICDGMDNNCNGAVDEGVIMTFWYSDADADGYGDPSSSISSCIAPQGFISNNSDCDDANAGINPGMVEICGNGVDDDCDGQTDEIGCQ